MNGNNGKKKGKLLWLSLYFISCFFFFFFFFNFFVFFRSLAFWLLCRSLISTNINKMLHQNKSRKKKWESIRKRKNLIFFFFKCNSCIKFFFGGTIFSHFLNFILFLIGHYESSDSYTFFFLLLLFLLPLRFAMLSLCNFFFFAAFFFFVAT